ncbi:hypothetical protein B0O99DRAFT_660570 [Bisporella sp. PMI_857]|nr:hypothetical protein B0O99DRAFT_660570 [Bisporella sp. PMI_857]
MLALTGTTGKIGGAVLDAILKENLLPPSELVLCTSSNPSDARWEDLKSRGAQVRQSNYDDPESMTTAFAGCSKLFLVSTPRIQMDFNDAPNGEGREKHHIAAINAARSAGVSHIYYTSLAFEPNSLSGVMRAHLRTEAFLHSLTDIKYTTIREGLYNESWPLYLGYYDLKNDDRDEILLAGDGEISWTSIAELGLGTALVIVEAGGKYAGKTFYLSNPNTVNLDGIAKTVSKIKGREVTIKIVSREEYIKHYVARGKEKPAVEWWSLTYPALNLKECKIQDNALVELLSSKGRELKPVEETVKEMLSN